MISIDFRSGMREFVSRFHCSLVQNLFPFHQIMSCNALVTPGPNK
uniref:Uncharacterized protein n=1 Tax=Arundo donax TaxID=35708 RepID=A0A0A9EGN3_ARUDO